MNRCPLFLFIHRPIHSCTGDTFIGEISRADVAAAAVASLDAPDAANVTFEVRSKLCMHASLLPPIHLPVYHCTLLLLALIPPAH